MMFHAICALSCAFLHPFLLDPFASGPARSRRRRQSRDLASGNHQRSKFKQDQKRYEVYRSAQAPQDFRCFLKYCAPVMRNALSCQNEALKHRAASPPWQIFPFRTAKTRKWLH